MTRVLGRLLTLLDHTIAWLAGLALLIITVVLFTNSMSRYFAGIAIIGGEELARYLMVWMTFLGSYLLVRVQRHVSVDVLARLLPSVAVRVLDIIVGCVGAVVLGFMAWIGWDLASFIMNTGQMMSSLPIRRGWIYMSVPVGCGLMAFAYTIQVVIRLAGGELPRPERFGLAGGPDEQAAVVASESQESR
ncbi:TRAP-type C4-dicarboxylate transport system permease small subunit [Natronocella acetinitrilica]|uniref:TRAP transporter small permease protein n=1 Tax=Natronocella acetinitrilica TaxID=414046 RepID=A0AAE3KA44_9GAMM|nr:TRAP transporter small permease [Natronocella acetinitrilica]MCP1673760.1 TRAP-type C4-dicarboxylate transport system permease small subunit [Natronocella acetinitrilica]